MITLQLTTETAKPTRAMLKAIRFPHDWDGNRLFYFETGEAARVAFQILWGDFKHYFAFSGIDQEGLPEDDYFNTRGALYNLEHESCAHHHNIDTRQK